MNKSPFHTLFMIAYFVGLLSACKSKSSGATSEQKSTPQDTVTTSIKKTSDSTQNSNKQAVVSAEIYRVVFLFISRGAGADVQSLTAFEKWLNERPKAVKWEHTHWGREGEQSYCLKLDELSTSEEKAQFVADARIFLGNKDLVLIQENVPCKG
jgi:hypothetical protein